MKKIVLIHAVQVAIQPIVDAFNEHWPEAELIHLWDQTLSIERAKTDHINDFLYQRIDALYDLAKCSGGDAIMFTCSAFGEAIDRVAEQSDIPVLKPNQAMFEQALMMGGKVGMIGSFLPAMEGMEKEFIQLADLHNSSASISSICVAKAREALTTGNINLHNQLTLEATYQLEQCSVIMLAHFSSSHALNLLTSKCDKPILSSPKCAIEYIKNQLITN
ncbi:aspartate/glutamate racemase family protein [Psychromonas sp. KJ10-10]|uniref:aspartate/glutamate racemase family protein n=1 Tax=Psychromonas sp. KJ10-10 TaxID=3391823 RepID=UPI0039B3CFFA